LLYARDDLAEIAELTEESIWLFGEQSLPLANEISSGGIKRSVAFPDGGIYVIGDHDDAGLMTIDAGPQGTGRCGHGHADALSVLFTAGSQRWLVDPGTHCYISDTDDRDRFRSTAAHNTVRLDQQDQAVPDGPFGWNSIPEVGAELWSHGETFDLFVGRHNGYARLADPVIHRRFVFHSRGGPWLIRDVVEGSEIHEVEAAWHFAPSVCLEPVRGGFEATTSSQYAPAGLALFIASRAGANGFIETGSISPAYGSRETAPVLRVRAQARLPLEFATLLAPRRITAENLLDQNASDFRAISKERDSVEGYSYSSGDTTHLFLFSGHGHGWALDGWESDAVFLYCRQSNGRTAHLVMVNGKSVKHLGKSLIQHHQVIERFEWLKRGDAIVTHCSNQSVNHTLDREPELDSVS
jgi:hypothetical protein